MQAIEHNGFRRPIEPFHRARLKALLDDSKVKEVRVFKLKQGMIINIEGLLYRVAAVRPNGKVILKPKKAKKGPSALNSEPKS